MTDRCWYNWNHCGYCGNQIDINSLGHIVIIGNVCYHRRCYDIMVAKED